MPTLTVVINRTRMCMGKNSDPAYSYDGLVSTKSIDRSRHNYFVISDRKEYVSFADATKPRSLDEMELGWLRYEAVVRHEEQAKAKLLELAKTVYPELKPARKWPDLWVTIPGFDASHDVKKVKVKV